MSKIVSLTKSLMLGILFIPLYPVLFLLPKYEAYIFVITTGRSGSGSLANIMKTSSQVHAVHEPYPILNNSFMLKSRWQKVWIFYQFYFIKVPLILLSKISGKRVYLETNHLFIKSFEKHARFFFKNRLKLIYMERPVEKVAKSIYEIGKIPGNEAGNKWYLDPNTGYNKIDFERVFHHLDDPEKEKWRKFYQCAWYWHEIKARADEVGLSYRLLRLDTSELNNPFKLMEKLETELGIEKISLKNQAVDRNLKSDEKTETISDHIATEKVRKFEEALSKWRQEQTGGITFSVIIPLYNKERYIEATIQSVLNQTYGSFELIVIDDGSTDESLRKVKTFNDPRIKVIEQKNDGVSVARNRGIKEAEHGWVFLLDGDDAWHPNLLEEFSKHISLDDSYIAYGCAYKRKRINGKELLVRYRSVPDISGELKNFYKSSFFGASPFNSSGICLNKRMLIDNNIGNLFPPGVKRGEDLDAWVKLASSNRLYFINKPLAIVNEVSGSASTKPYDYDESFRYENWFFYNTDSIGKKLFLYLVVLKRKFHIIKKILISRLEKFPDKS